jgi:triacylglycerol lipase
VSNQHYSLLLLVISVLALGTLAFLLWRALRPRPRRPAALRYPIVLVHGVAGFGKIGSGALSVSYFRGVGKAMRAAGATVYEPHLPAFGSVPARAEALAAFIRALPEAKVNIVAHSMGGLDARWAVSCLGLAARVACLVTVATPHRGSPLADLAVRAGVDTNAIAWLTTSAAERINAEALDHPSVVYGSVVARAGKALWRTNPILFAPWLLMRRAHGESDGLVPVESQRWGSVWMEVEHDHWGQVGWAIGVGPESLYVRTVQELAARGG